MRLWILILLGAAGALFAAKLVYIITVAMTVGTTRGALYVSTSHRRIQAALDALPLQSGQVLMDLGCGDGRALRAAKKRCALRAIGYEINPLAYCRAKLFCAARGIEVRYGNFWNEAIQTADIVFCYLFPDVMAALEAKIKEEAKPGALVVSFNFPLPGLPPLRILRPEGSRQSDPIYIYRVASGGAQGCG